MEIKHNALGLSSRPDDSYGYWNVADTNHLSFSFKPVLEQFTRTADLTGAQQRLDHTGRDAITDSKARHQGELLVETAHVLPLLLGGRPGGFRTCFEIRHQRFLNKMEKFNATATHSHAR
jgi:hypothetical protein